MHLAVLESILEIIDNNGSDCVLTCIYVCMYLSIYISIWSKGALSTGSHIRQIDIKTGSRIHYYQ